MIRIQETRSRPAGRRHAGSLPILTLSLLLAMAGTSPAQNSAARAPELFNTASGAEERWNGDDSSVLRERSVSIAPHLIAALREGSLDRVEINLFVDVSLLFVVASRDPGSHGHLTLHGGLEGLPRGKAAITLGPDGTLVGSVRASELGSFRIGYLEDGSRVVREIDFAALPPCGGAVPPRDAPGDRRDERGDRMDERDSSSTIEVLAVYSDDARVAAGGTTAMIATVVLAVSETNAGWNNSLVSPNLVLVGVGEVAYAESGVFATDLDRLFDPDDGHLDVVHEIRDIVGADVVSLIVDSGDACGRAYVMTTLSTDFEDHAFSVVALDCATGYYSFGHEIGHNQGCHHDHAQPGDGLYDYSHGHRWDGDSGTEFRSVMAYQPGTRVNHYSNPDVNHDGQPTGVPTDETDPAHNALTINNSAWTVANFRQSRGGVVWVDFSNAAVEDGSFEHPYNTVVEGIAMVATGGAVAIKAGVTAESPRITKEMTMLAFDGVVRIGN